ncbi:MULTISPECIES: hypothetical protein [Nocardia]|uniref:hypothetical protein n=1 Tax=Nocardia abscessus TaxID=120957 RepID=UPI00189350F4|nr:hypothetical protein [Nocardia abscessus]MBF6473882.1 hypothetical protein [Nocardia abscessus]
MKKMISAALVIGAAAAGIAIQSGAAGAIEADGLYDTERKCWDAIEEASRNGTYNAPPFTYYCKQTPSGKWIITR